jgi:hypothetical protein
MSKHDDKPKEGSTAHKQVPGDTSAAVDAGTGPMPMNMTGKPASSPPDPDQKSSRVPPKTVETNLPDGSQSFADPDKPRKASKAKAGTYRVLSPVKTGGTMYDVGAEVELDAAEAASLGDNIEPA